MDTVMDATLVKWGNSQGLRIPKDVCDLLGISVGSKAEVALDAAHSSMTLTFDQQARNYHRTQRITLQELCAGWDGGKVGEELIGGSVGAEVMQ